MASRRTVLVGLGGLVAGGGALIGTGAFDTVEAERTVNVESAGDAEAFLGLRPADRAGEDREDNEYVSEPDGGTIAINLDGDSEDDGLNQNANTTFRNLVEVTNQGSQTVDSITLDFTGTPGDVTASDTFRFPVDEADDDGEDMVNNGDDILTDNNDIPGSLGPGEAVDFGLEVDLISGGTDDNDLPSEGSYTLTITAESADD